MGEKTRCPRCEHVKSWSVRRGKRRCVACRYEWRPRALPLRLTLAEWRRLLRWFVLGQSAAVIAQEAGLERKRVMRALLPVRQAMAADVPATFSGVVEVDETYLGGTWRNKRLGERAQGTKRGRGTTKQAVFGILCRGGQVWQRGATSTRLVDHSQAFSDRKGSHVNGLEGFWSYLKRRLAAKGGIRRERLPLYLAEYVWRYNHRRLSPAQQVRTLLKLLQS